MARKRFLKAGGGERLLTAKLQILNGTGSRRPSLALGILTGRVPEPIAEAACPDSYLPPVPNLRLLPPLPPVEAHAEPSSRQYTARTAYLADRHLEDLDAIIEAWQHQAGSARRVTRSAVIREAIEHLRKAVDAGTVVGPNASLTPETK